MYIRGMRHPTTSSLMVLAAGLAAVLCSVGLRAGQGATESPQAAVDALLSTDRAFSAASARTDLVTGLSAMFAPDVVMPFPPGQLADTAARATDALRANPDNPPSKIEWTPVRGGLSADGQHGFTFGFMTWHRADGTDVGLKYLAYWVKRVEGWRVVAYKRGRRADGTPPLALMAPALPASLVPASADPAVVARHRDSLDQAERAFSRDAQTIGLGPAFAQYGSADAVNMGGPMDVGFVVGSEAIGKAVGGGGAGSPVSWAPDKVVVASSGDLGVTIGYIRPNAPPAGGSAAPRVPFFTVWRRASANAPWKYIAE